MKAITPDDRAVLNRILMSTEPLSEREDQLLDIALRAVAERDELALVLEEIRDADWNEEAGDSVERIRKCAAAGLAGRLAAKQAVSVEERDKLKAQLDAEGRVARLMNLNRGEIESGLDSHMTLSSYDGIYVQLHPDAFGIAFKLTEVGATKAERLIHALQQVIDKVRTGNLKGGWNGFR